MGDNFLELVNREHCALVVELKLVAVAGDFCPKDVDLADVVAYVAAAQHVEVCVAAAVVGETVVDAAVEPAVPAVEAAVVDIAVPAAGAIAVDVA